MVSGLENSACKGAVAGSILFQLPIFGPWGSPVPCLGVVVLSQKTHKWTKEQKM